MKKLTRCENCTGELVYNPEKEALVCERCASCFVVSEQKGCVSREYDSLYNPQNNQDENVLYRCETCNTKIIMGDDVNARRCSSCGNTTLVKEKASIATPDGIIPFKISRKRAAEIFRIWVSKRKFAPSDLVQMAKLEKISGIYTPVWNFNYNWVSKYTAIGVEKVLDVYDNEIRKETNVKKINEGKVENEIYSASTRIPTEVIGVLNDYDLNMIRPFSSEYLLGFSGVDTNIGIHEVYNNIEENLNETNRLIAIRKLKDEFDYYDDLKCVTKVRNVIFNYAYVPVWANHYTYKGKEYHCYINGQTGKTTGSAPKSVAKILGTVFGILCGIGAVVLLITSLI